MYSEKLEQSKPKYFPNKKINNYIVGKGTVRVSTNIEFRVENEHNGKRWITVVIFVFLNSPVHNEVALFRVERDVYIQNMVNNITTSEILVDVLNTLFKDVERYMRKETPSIMKGEFNFLQEKNLFEEVYGFLNNIFKSE